MPRGPRLDARGALHHVMVRGIERRALFVNDADRADFVCRLTALARGQVCGVYAWALMPNHVHLLLRTGTVGLSNTMRRLLTGFAVQFNRRHQRSGHLFQNRFKSILVEEERYLLELVRYLHLNPVRAGIVEDLEELDGYAWTGHARLMGTITDGWQEVDEVLGQFGATAGSARASYRAFVADGLSHGRRPELAGGGLRRSRWGWNPTPELDRGREAWVFDERVLGGSEFVERLLVQAAPSEPSRVRTPIDARQLVQAVTARVAEEMGIPIECLFNGRRTRTLVAHRALVCFVAVHAGGLALRTVAEILGVSAPTVMRGVRMGPGILRRTGLRVDALLP